MRGNGRALFAAEELEGVEGKVFRIDVAGAKAVETWAGGQVHLWIELIFAGLAGLVTHG
jgi:hypothetical protein